MIPRPITLDDLRRFAVGRSLFAPTTLKRALTRLGYVQADPIRAPARAQDLILRHRVIAYRAGDLERLYPTLGVEEDFFLAYGFVTRSIESLMHPRSIRGIPVSPGVPWSRVRRTQAERLLEFVRERGAVHPREVAAHFSPRSVRNYWEERPTRRPRCLRACTTVACCASSAATRAFASMRRTGMETNRQIRQRSAPAWMRWLERQSRSMRR